MAKRPNHRPKLEIDFNKVDKYLYAGCNGVSIASMIGVAPDTLYLRVEAEKGMTFSAYAQLKRSQGDDMLRVKQFESAYEDKEKTMLIWLGKQRLGQKDKIENNNNNTETAKIVVETEDQAKELTEYLNREK